MSKGVSKGTSKGASRRRQSPTVRGNARQRAHSYQRGEEIVALLRRHGPLSVAALADRLPISPAAVWWQLKRLEAAGAVTARLETTQERQARVERYYQPWQVNLRRSPRLLLYRAASKERADVLD